MPPLILTLSLLLAGTSAANAQSGQAPASGSSPTSTAEVQTTPEGPPPAPDTPPATQDGAPRTDQETGAIAVAAPATAEPTAPAQPQTTAPPRPALPADPIPTPQIPTTATPPAGPGTPITTLTLPDPIPAAWLPVLPLGPGGLRPDFPAVRPRLDREPQDRNRRSSLVLPPTPAGRFSAPNLGGGLTGAAPGPTPVGIERSDERALHAGLPWDFCGPRRRRGNLVGPLAAPAASNIPVDASARRSLYDLNTQLAVMEGEVRITQGDQHLTADRSSYNRRTGDVNATGDVALDYPGIRLHARQADYNLQSRRGTLQDVRYRLFGNSNLRGTAATAQLLPGDISQYREVTYTTCPPGRRDWALRARDLKLDQPEGMGVARDAVLRVGGIPVFYSPYLRFPIDDRRRSGFLPPAQGHGRYTGLDIILPYYWNIAPNYDATFYPRLMSSRGLMLGVELRGLTGHQKATIAGEVLPHDQQNPELGARGTLRVSQNGTFGLWSTLVNASWVSDQYYLDSFGANLDAVSQRNLSQLAILSYGGVPGFGLYGMAQTFQTVDPTLPTASRPYSAVPTIGLVMTPKRWGAAEFNLESYYSYFDHTALVHGNRGVIIPSVRFPLRRSYGFITPRVRLLGTGYALTNANVNQPAQQNYLVPSLDLDSGLLFDRDIKWFGHDGLQTLEPRVYYVLTNYLNQSQAPLFDTTTLGDFSYASLFRPNRFTGYDRIGDENRLTVGLTSRTLGKQTGREWLRASIGRQFFFEPQRVQLYGTTPDTRKTSPFAGELAMSPSASVTARASVQWDPNLPSNPFERRVLQLRYAPGDNYMLNLAYRYNLVSTDLNQYKNTDLSFRLPVTKQVRVVGRWLYSLLNNGTDEAILGIEYGRCCWRVTLLGRYMRTINYTSTGVVTTAATTGADRSGNLSVMLQIELAGLGAFGNKIDKLLARGIYGYEMD